VKGPPSSAAVDRGLSLQAEAEQLIGALANPWRSRILGALCLRALSPSRFVAEVGGEISTISRHFRWLADAGYISLVEERTGGSRRGAVERLYVTTPGSLIDSREWAALPIGRRRAWTRSAVAMYFRRIVEAIDGDTFESESDRHFSWDAVALDRQGWGELTERLDEILAWLPRLEAESARRAVSAPERPVLATVGLGAFSSPPQTKPLRSATAGGRIDPSPGR
jgi:DNA-binding transcriptional ArsR family regulator